MRAGEAEEMRAGRAVAWKVSRHRVARWPRRETSARQHSTTKKPGAKLAVAWYSDHGRAGQCQANAHQLPLPLPNRRRPVHTHLHVLAASGGSAHALVRRAGAAAPRGCRMLYTAITKHQTSRKYCMGALACHCHCHCHWRSLPLPSIAALKHGCAGATTAATA